MDLLVCPSCHQSVLDDDAVVCPFCGAAMDGSSGPTQPTNKPAAKARPTAESKLAATGEKKPKPAAAKAAPAEKSQNQDPFAVKSQVNQQAIPLRRKPTAKVSYRVVCPMCDTNGFATPAVAGKEVKCPNPSCLMPVFVAPEIKKEAPPEPKKSLFTPLNITLAAVGLVAIGGGIFYATVLNVPAPQPDQPPPLHPGLIGQQTEEQPEDVQQTPQAPPKMPIAELQAQALSAGVDAARQRDDNRSKEFCRVLTASAYAVRGQLQEAEGQLTAFDNLRSGLDFMKIAPLSQIAWQHLQKGDRAAAEKVANQALALVPRLPQSGANADVVQQGVALGTLLIALERFQEARELIETRESLSDVAQSAARISLVIHDRSFDLSKSYGWLPRVELASPLTFAVTYGAVLRGHENQARQWIDQLQTAERRSTSLVAYAAGLAMKASQQGQPVSLQALQSVENVTDQDRQLAQALALQVAHQNQPAAVAALQEQVQSAIGQWEIPAPAILPEFRGIYEGVFTSPGPEIRPALQTHLLLARSLMLSGQIDQAWQQIETALQWTKAIAPSKSAVAAVVDNIDQNRAQIENQLGTLLNQQRADQKRTAFNQYRKNARTIEEQALLRSTLETRILNLALDWNLANPLLAAYQQELATPGEHSNLVSLVEAGLIPELIFALRENGNTAAAQELQGKWTEQPVSKSTRQAIQQLKKHLAAGEVQQAQLFVRNQAALLNDPLLLLRLSCELAEKATPDVMVEWVNSIPDPVEQELAFRLTAAQLTQRGLIRELWQASGRRNLSATDKCSLTLGLMEGLSTTNVYAEPVSAAAE